MPYRCTRLLSVQRRDREYLWLKGQQVFAVLAHKSHHLRQRFWSTEQVDLVQHNHNFFAPFANALHKGAFALSKGAVYRSNEEDQVTPGDKFFSETIMLAQHSIDTWGIYDGNITQKISGKTQFKDLSIAQISL